MRSLPPAPQAFVDPETGAPAYGSYEGFLPRVRLERLGMGDRVARRKRWLYLALGTDAAWVSLAVVRTGYATTAFLFVFDLDAKAMLVDRTVIGPATAAVADDPHAEGELARFAFVGADVRMRRGAGAGGNGPLHVRARFKGVDLDATLDESAAPPSITAIAELGAGRFDATEKRALATVRGAVSVRGRRILLDGGFGGWDYTHGLLPRHTRWRWAFAMGRAVGGEPVAFNVAQGFVGEAECAAFFAGRVHPLVEPAFAFGEPLDPWRLTGDGIDLTFEPGAVHAQYTNLLLVKSRFVQPVGRFRGTLRVGDRSVELDGVPGVCEDQDVLW